MGPREKWVITGPKAGPGVVRQYSGADGPGSRQAEPDKCPLSHFLAEGAFPLFIVLFIQHDKCHRDISFDGSPDLGHPNLMKPGVNQCLEVTGSHEQNRTYGSEKPRL